MPLYGLVIAVSCVAAAFLVAAIYGYSSLQSNISNLAYSYSSIVRLEAFQMVISGHENLSTLMVQDATIDQLSLYGSNGIFVIRGNTDRGLYSVTG